MSSPTTIRPARKDDLERTAEMLNEHSQALHGADDLVPSDLLQYWESPDVEFPDDVLVAESAGAISGYADVGLHGEHAWLDVRATAPDVLPGLLEAIERRAGVKKQDAKLLTVRTMREGEERRFYDAQMASFADTWLFTVDPYESWRHWMVDGPSFDPLLWFVAEKGDDLAGIVIARALENEPGVGWIRILGVVPDHRQQGVGQALLRCAFREFANRGFNAVGLGVDAENPTGAVRVYERAGMHVERTYLLFEKVQG